MSDDAASNFEDSYNRAAVIHDPRSCWLGQGSGPNPITGEKPYCTGGEDCKPRGHRIERGES